MMTDNRRNSRRRTTPPAALSRRDVLKALGGLAITLPLGSMIGPLGSVLSANAGEPSMDQTAKLALRFARYYKPVAVTARPQIPGYPLPLDTSKVTNFRAAAAALDLAGDEPSLKANGFAVLPGAGNEDIVEPYKDLKKRGVPVFVTADTLLHLYHVQFDETLKDIEEREFYKDIVALAEALTAELARTAPPADNDEFHDARQKALTYFAIGLKALKPDAKLPKEVARQDVDQVLAKMAEHEGFWPEPQTAETEWPLFRYAEDFSQYVPRGHYTRSETLKKYFVGMMWFGRMTFILKGDRVHGPDDEPALVSVPESNRQTLAAALITRLLDRAVLPDGRKAAAVWERIYAVTSFYVGLADDLGMEEYRAALARVSGAALDLAVLADPQKLTAFKLELARHNPPAIYSGTGGQGTFEDPDPNKLLEALNKSMGFRLMGQRFVPDSYMMGKLVFPTVGEPTREGMFTYVMSAGGPIRGFPRGLDVMALLGSRRARDLLHQLGDDAYAGGLRGLSYEDALTALRKEYAKLSDADWNRNLYWSWLHALKPLLAEYGRGYQSFMGTTAYRTKSLTTALASWAQLRHDTILYAKQSYTMLREVSNRVDPPEKPVQGYVEPLPEFYARLLALARMTNQGLSEMKVLDDRARARLDAFEKLVERLLAISEKELANEELTETDYAFIRNFGENLESVAVPPDPATGQAQSMKTTLVADVHTDQNSQQVLEEGTGYVDLGVFVYRQPDGRLVLGAGPVLSYHEFKHPMNDRLTDEKWRELLKSEDVPARPEWTVEYLSRRTRYTCRTKG
jgi:hypothetical protein